jgi:hypothetical protein
MPVVAEAVPTLLSEELGEVEVGGACGEGDVEGGASGALTIRFRLDDVALSGDEALIEVHSRHGVVTTFDRQIQL